MAAPALMVTFEEMTEVPRRDGVMTGVNRLLGLFLHYSVIFIMFDAPKEIALQEKMPVHCKYVSECVLYMNQNHSRAN